MGEKKVNMKISMIVEGTEGFDAEINFQETTIEVVKAVQNKVMQGLIDLNNAS